MGAKKHKKKRTKNKAPAKVKKAPTLYDGLSKCLESGHISFASFPVAGAEGISKLHACSQCGLMFWEE